MVCARPRQVRKPPEPRAPQPSRRLTPRDPRSQTYPKNLTRPCGLHESLASHTRVVRDVQDPDPVRRKRHVVRSIRARDSLQLTALEPCLLYTSPSPRDGLLSRM